MIGRVLHEVAKRTANDVGRFTAGGVVAYGLFAAGQYIADRLVPPVSPRVSPKNQENSSSLPLNIK